MMSRKKPDSFLGWLGRQVGFVGKAIKTDVTAPKKVQQSPQEPEIVYRSDTIEEVPHPADPKLVLRRTTTDEVIRDDKQQ